MNPDHYGHGWHATGTIGAVAAAAASAALLGHDQDQAARAISIGASQAAGLRQNFGTGTKPFHAGNAARSGVTAAKLARHGLEADPTILESRWGFFNVFTPPSDQQHPEFLPGERWHLLEPGIATKVFPSCGATHPGIGAMLELRERGLEPDDVDHIEARVVDMTARILEFHRPTTGLEAKFSLEYVLARALVSGHVELDDFAPGAVTEEKVANLLERIDMRVDPTLTKEWVWGTPRATEVTVHLKDGEALDARAVLPPGSPGNFRRDMLDAKFEDCMRRGQVVGDVDEIRGLVDGLEQLADVRQLLAKLRAQETG